MIKIDMFIFILDTPVQIDENHIPLKMIENSSITIQLMDPQSGRIKRRNFAILLLIFLISIASLCIVYILFPKIDPYVFTENFLQIQNLYFLF